MRIAWVLIGAGLLLAAGPEPTLRQADATGVLGRTVRDAGLHVVGRIVDIVVDASGNPQAVVVDTGGFMGLGARRVAVDWAAVHMPALDSPDTTVTIDLTDEQIQAAPDYNDRTKPALIVGAPPPEIPAPPIENGKAPAP